ncbi:MAG: ABC transporter permease subunit [Actinomycetota bacterium]|nr:ABC transporter permease subunit [Actinomycetota bacterium]
MSASALDAPARPQDRVIKRGPKRRDWSKWGLGTYFAIFLVFLYGPMIVMAILSLQGYYGAITFPFKGPFGFNWWRSLLHATVSGSPTHATDIHTAAKNSLFLSVAAGLIVAFIAFTLSMAFRRRWRFRTDAAAFYVIMLALMTPGFLLAVGTQLFWNYLGLATSIWKTALGANVVWGIPFGFLVMLSVWNRYDPRIEEAARDLGADQRRTFREVTLPLVWTGIFGCFLFGFTLTWNDYDRSVLFQSRAADSLPLEIGGITFTGGVRPDLYALGTATTLFSLLVIGVLLVVASLRLRFRATPVRRVEEELGVAEAIDAGVVGAAAAPPAKE